MLLLEVYPLRANLISKFHSTSTFLMKYIKSLLFISVAVSLTVFTAHAAPPKVSNVTAKQREGTKLVDITYDLALDAGQTAYVEAWFSYDNGLSFPISAKEIEPDGLIGAGVNSGENHALVWNAGIDWNQKFTATGKIRIIATYGLQPSGLLSGHAIGDSSLVRVEWKLVKNNPFLARRKFID